MNLSQINTNCIEGRLLIAALSSLTVSPLIHLNEKELDGRKMQPDEVLNEVLDVANFIYKDNPLPLLEQEATSFESELTQLLNKFSKENESDTPDFILSKFVQNALFYYSEAVKSRDKWFGVSMWDKAVTHSKWND